MNYQSIVVVLAIVALGKSQISFYPLVPRVENIENRQDDGLRYRLPNDTKPETYDITLTTRVDIQNFTFDGIVRIGIVVIEPTSTITLHYRQLTIQTVRLWYTVTDPPVAVEIDLFTYDVDVELLRIPVTGGQLVRDARYTLEIHYTGTLRQDNGGFYRSRYLNNDGNEVWLATTQFSPTNARHAFPSYDEPYLKASYTIRITHGSTYMALSNMEVSPGFPVVNGDGTTTTQFNPTPLVSSYLIGFVISDFIGIENPSQGKVPHRVFARSNAIDKCFFILDTGVQLLDAISNYLGIDYPMPKMDQVAIPDFYFSAMENWGLTTYRERQFLYNEAVTEYSVKTSIVTTVSHEFGHNWFGNLVTPSWWSYLWLKEGFANLLQHVGTNLIHPEWRILDYYVVNTMQDVFLSDELETTRPMTHYVESDTAVLALFDNIAYAKSGCVLRMFLHALTESTFVKGLNNYLIAKSFSDATEEDLFDALQAAIIENNQTIPVSFHIIMSSWTRQSGFPVLTVERDYQSTTIILSQQRSLQNTSNTQDLSTWWIPYNFVTASSIDFSDTSATHWLAQGTFSENITLPTIRNDDWLIVNKQEAGYYRVKYDERNYKLIADALVSDVSQVHSVSRAQLIDDAFNFAKRDELSFAVFLDLIRFLEWDNDYIPWAAADRAFSFLDVMLSGHVRHNHFRDFIRKLTGYMYESVGIDDFPTEPHLRKYARTLSLKWACTAGSTICREDTLRRLRTLDSNVEFHQNIRSQMYCGLLRSSTKYDFDYVWARLLSSNDTAYRQMITTALACTESSELLSMYLNTSLVSTNPYNNVTYQNDEPFSVFNAVYRSGTVGLELAMSFLEDNIDEAFTTYGNTSISNAINGMASFITNHNQHEQFTMLTSVLGNIVSSNVIENANTVIVSNIDWLEQHGPIIDAWLVENHEFENSEVESSATTTLISIFTVVATIASTVRYYVTLLS